MMAQIGPLCPPPSLLKKKNKQFYLGKVKTWLDRQVRLKIGQSPFSGCWHVSDGTGVFDEVVVEVVVYCHKY